MVKFCTFNCCGLGDGKPEYISSLLDRHDIVLLQETWLLKDNLNFFDRIPGTESHGISSINDAKLLQGRPYGGCSIIWKKSLVFEVSPVTLNTPSTRLCAVNVKLPNGVKLLVVNAYMPCDFVPANLADFRQVLDEISVMINSGGCDYVVIGGDLNTDFRRASQNTTVLSNFVVTESLVKGISFPEADVPYTYESRMNAEKSTLDHFLVCERLFPSISGYKSCHDGDNLSDHSPLSMSIEIDVASEAVEHEEPSGTHFNWDRTTEIDITLFQNELNQLLGAIEIPNDLLECRDLRCTQHDASIQYLYDAIVDACMTSSANNIPTSTARPDRVLPGWNEGVEEHKRRAIFWHNLWKSNGSPREGTVADIRRRTRAQYHYAIKTVRKNQERHKAQNFAESLLNKNNNNFWQDIKNMSNSRAKHPTSMDGHVGKEAIGNHLAEKYERLYNSVSYDKHEMTLIKKEIDSLISSRCNCNTASCRSLHGTTVVDIKNAVSLLHRSKSDGLIGLSTNHLKYGTNRLYTLISVLFTGILEHGYIPQEMLKSTIIPIPKNLKKSLSDSSNYRAIALNSPLCKLLEAVILNKCSDTLKSSDMQFGYKKGVSTSSCTYVVNEVIQYYKNGGSSVHAMLLDASQAFDRVVYTKLLKTLLEKGLCPIIARTIAFLYIHQQMRIRWTDFHSDFFIVTNGVKQGGILSPALFSVYIDVLLLRLKRSGFGCYIGDTCVGAFAYADDIILLCPTKFSLRTQLDIATVFSDEYQILFNPTKCQLLFYSPDNRILQIELIFQNISVRSQPTAVHLGHLIGPGVEDGDIQRIISDFNRRVNVLISKFYFCWLETKVKLFQTYCMSLYGSILWDLSDKNVNLFYIAWRKAIRKFFGLDHMTHSILLPLITGLCAPDFQLEKRLLLFLRKNNQSKNTYVKLCANHTLRGSRSSVSNSLSFLVNKHRIPRSLIINYEHISLTEKPPHENNLTTAGLIRDLIRLRESGVENIDVVNNLIRLAGVG